MEAGMTLNPAQLAEDEMTEDLRRHIFWCGAKDALRLAYECEEAALQGDRRHAEHWLAEAKRHRERAAWYLSRRNLTVFPIEVERHDNHIQH